MKLIDLEELQKFPIRIDHYDKENGDLKFILGIEVVFDYAESLPVIEQEPMRYPVGPTNEAEPVRHGRWERDECGIYCPYCKYIPQWDDDKYCGNCGARMDGDNDAAD